LFTALVERGAKVKAYDRFIGADAAKRAGVDDFHGSDLEGAVRDADAAFITTVDPMFRDADWARLTPLMRTPVLIDGRNVLRNVRLPDAVRYYPIGQRRR
jgi:UDPglucose 6-dehydrogenase